LHHNSLVFHERRAKLQFFWVGGGQKSLYTSSCLRPCDSAYQLSPTLYPLIVNNEQKRPIMTMKYRIIVFVNDRRSLRLWRKDSTPTTLWCAEQKSAEIH